MTAVVAVVVVAVAMVVAAAVTAAMAVVAAVVVAVVAGAFNGGRWRHRLMEATQQPAGAQRQDKRTARQETERVK